MAGFYYHEATDFFLTLPVRNDNSIDMKRSILFIATFLIIVAFLIRGGLSAQSISGKLTLHSGQSIKLEGFNGLETYPIDSTTIDDKGNFKLHYSRSDHGVAFLTSADDKPFIVILSGENINRNPKENVAISKEDRKGRAGHQRKRDLDSSSRQYDYLDATIGDITGIIRKVDRWCRVVVRTMNNIVMCKLKSQKITTE